MTFAGLGTALGLGLLVGLQRQWSGSHIAGVRTFPLVTLAGAVAGLLARELGGSGWVVGAGVVAVAGLAIMANWVQVRRADAMAPRNPGITTEVALVVMFVLGAYATVGPPSVVAAIGVAVAALLQLKDRLHGLVGRIGPEDMRAIVLFAAITFIVLPVLPDRVVLTREMGELAVWNPRNIWLMVVLVCGVSLAGYLVYKSVGDRAGTIINGLLGGVISSTATTVAFARRSAGAGPESSGSASAAAVVIVLAGSVVYARLLLAVWVVAPGFWPTAAGPLGCMLAVSLACATVVWLVSRKSADGAVVLGNPTELRTALVFAAIYASVLLAVAAGRRYLGAGGIYAVSVLSGLTDMDAITLSTSRLVTAELLEPATGWRAIIVASMSNIVFKTAIVATLGSRSVLRIVAGAMGVKFCAGALLLVLW